MRRRAVLTPTVFSSAIAMGAAAGCGGSSDDHDKSVASQAAAQAVAQERQRQQHATEQQNIRNLKRELRRTRRKKDSNGGGSSPGSGGSKDCGSGITANSVTTCPFARNVVKAYRSSGGAGEVDVYSPVTSKTYHMACSGTSTTTCTGGHDASVTFTPSARSSSDGDFCSTHHCIPSFDEGHGYIVQCADREWSHSGGRRGACSQHGGETGNTYP